MARVPMAVKSFTMPAVSALVVAVAVVVSVTPPIATGLAQSRSDTRTDDPAARRSLEGFAHVMRQLVTERNALRLAEARRLDVSVTRRIRRALDAAAAKLSGLDGVFAERARKSVAAARNTIGSDGPAIKSNVLPAFERVVTDMRAVETALARLGSNDTPGTGGPDLSRRASDVEGGGEVARAGDRLVGMTVVDPEGERVGTVGDIVRGRDGRVRFVTVLLGGFLGTAARRFAVPAEDLRLQDGRLTTRLPHDRILRHAQ
ncbi:MAG: PRC-barrel domain-containing protein [Hyphomicrobiaceae bacterium]